MAACGFEVGLAVEVEVDVAEYLFGRSGGEGREWVGRGGGGGEVGGEGHSKQEFC